MSPQLRTNRQRRSSQRSYPRERLALLPAFLAFFLAGFAFYAFAAAAAGALVARQEEVQAATVPITMPLMIGYLLVYAAISSPNATWVKVVRVLLPPTATMMPARIALGHIAWWEIPLDAVIMLGAIYAMARIASRVYTNALIHGGARLSWRAALRLAEPRPLETHDGALSRFGSWHWVARCASSRCMTSLANVAVDRVSPWEKHR